MHSKIPEQAFSEAFPLLKNPVFVKTNFQFFLQKTGKQERLEFYPWPETALREALTNSLAH